MLCDDAIARPIAYGKDTKEVTMSNKLEVELKYYAEMRERLIAETEGKFALIKGRDLVGTFDTRAAAYEKGIERFGNVPFLIKEIRRDERIEFIPFISVGYR